MDLRLLEYFVAVAELEHVGKAAARLHISQSPLSRQIRQLEKELNLQLFVRERQRIRLTEPGRWLLNQSQGLLAHFAKVREEAEQRSRGQIGTLSVAFTSAVMWSGILPKLLQRFETNFPDATVELHNMRSTLQLEAVRSGRADIGFVSTPASSSDIEVTCVSEEPSMLVIPCTHPLSGKRRIVPHDLDGVRWILLSESLSSQKHDRFVDACTSAGFRPQVVQKVTEPITLLALVESGLGVGLIRSSARNYAPRSLTFAYLPWFTFQSRTYMIRPADGRQPLAEAFAAYVPEIDAPLERQTLRSRVQALAAR
ncbi:MAG TPA: LysR family transcriptional regulator [Bryobacteraceae bacterium]